MLILAIDTSGRQGSVALCRGDTDNFETLQLMKLDGGTYSARLIPTIEAALEQNHLSASNVDAFAVVSGPGSFTGLRVGLATVKGLCEILDRPLITVSMLEALAINFGALGSRVTTIVDAGRGEVYVGEYVVSMGAATSGREYISKLSVFVGADQTAGELLTPDSNVADALRVAGGGIRLVAPIQADGIGSIGNRKLQAGDVADHASADVNYIRRSDAEIFSTLKP